MAGGTNADPEARQDPPMSLSRPGWMSSAELPAPSEPVGQGKPTPYSTRSRKVPPPSRRSMLSPLELSLPVQGPNAVLPYFERITAGFSATSR